MSVPRRIDSPIPFARGVRPPPMDFAHLGARTSEDIAASFERDDGARTPRASSQSTQSMLRPPRVSLPVCLGTPPRADLASAIGPALTQHLTAVSPTRYETHLSWEELDALLHTLWCAHRPQALRATPATLRLLRPDDAVAAYVALVAECQEDRRLTPAEFAWLVNDRLCHRHYTVVVAYQDRFIGTAAMFLQGRLSVDHAYVGHLDDIFVAEPWRVMRLGPSIINALTDLGDKLGVSHFSVAFDWRGSQGPYL